MSTHNITGRGSDVHVTEQNARDQNRIIFGEDSFVFNKGNNLAYEVVSSNEIDINTGFIMMQGDLIEVESREKLTIDNGTQGNYRNDLIVCRYSKDSSTGVETASLEVIKGTPSSTSASDPSYNDGAIDTDLVVDFPLYRVCLNSLNITSVVQLYTLLDIGHNVLVVDSLPSTLGPDGTVYLVKES